ncbi:protein NRT1/ PTR FAMILY 4.5-like [Canna indica]|uniref:Protein NRT1/ PTR FAMILY 4.5-like n=1 Tax=Canna indica TaxID=4628 RepID=A0AAQ3QPH3_9LILI|nr:protein NRT1/ PTR FAMILY 4.5-like [Canna indica]
MPRGLGHSSDARHEVPNKYLNVFGFTSENPQRLRKFAVGRTRFTITYLRTHFNRIAVGDCRDANEYPEKNLLLNCSFYMGETVMSIQKGQSTEVDEAGDQPHPCRNARKGGFRAAMFVFAMSALENLGFIANIVSLVLYFMVQLHFDLPGASTTLTNFMGATFLITLLGGFISDTYMTRLNTILLFAIFEILGYIFLTIQAHDASYRPAGPTSQLEGGNALVFYLTLCFLAAGFGGTRGAIPALGADQFDRNNPKEQKHLTSYFNWLLLSITLGATVGVTVIVWISTEKNKWALAFLISMLLAVAGFVCLAAGKPFYRVRVAGESALLRLIRVVVVASRNRKLAVPEKSDELYEVNEKEADESEEILPRTSQLRFLDKAAVLVEGIDPEPWKVCTVTQVEELKIVIRMLPILASTIIMNTCLAQLQTFSIAQGNIMDLHLGSFKVPPASIPVIPLVFMSLLLPLYNLVFIPLARRLTGHPSGITHLQRVGVGLVLSAVSMAIAAVVEAKRRRAFNYEGKIISLFWLSFQYGIFGIADMFTLVGLMEFFYSEAPAGMRSLSTSFSYLSLSLGYFSSSIFVHAINAITERLTPSRQGWIHGIDLNQNNLDLFYWFLAILSCKNFGVYLLCAKLYKYRRDVRHIEDGGAPDEEATINEGESNTHAAPAPVPIESSDVNGDGGVAEKTS